MERPGPDTADCIFCAIVHIHLIPRRADDRFGFRFPPGYGEQPARALLDEMAARITAGLPPSGAR